MPVEPPHPVVPGRPTHELIAPPVPTIRLAAGAGAVVLLLSSSGHVVVVGVLLGVVALDATAGVSSIVAGLGAALRWGTGSLQVAAGAQAVLGPAVVVGPELAAAGAGAGGLALLLACPGGWAAVPFGLAAGMVAAGPAATSGPDAALRVVAALAAVGAGWLSGRFLPKRVAQPAALVAAAAAVALQVAA